MKTHKEIDRELCGEPIELKEGYARVELKTMDRMKVDETGLVHGGFIFGLADYAAMIAVNHPNVVLGAADVKFLKPVKAGEIATAEAQVEPSESRKTKVNVTVKTDTAEVFQGIFTCFVLDKHVLK
jgi:uncharacterized protein (TIGR00369 family)